MNLDEQVRHAEVKAALESAARLASTLDQILIYAPLSDEGRKAGMGLMDELREQLRIAYRLIR